MYDHFGMDSRRDAVRRKERIAKLVEQINSEEYRLSDYFTHIEDIDPGTNVVILCRVSNHAQKKNLVDQLEVCVTAAEAERFIHVHEPILEVAHGYDFTREGLLKAIRIAREHMAFILIESVDRIIRHFDVSRFWDMTPTKGQLEELKKLLNGVRVIVVHHPDSSAKEIRKIQSNRGTTGKKNGDGKDNRKIGKRERFRNKVMSYVKKLDADGYGCKSIANKIREQYRVRVSHTAIRKWIKKGLLG